MHGSDDATAIEHSRLDGREFAIIFDRHYEAVRSFAARRMAPEDAIDVTAEVFRIAFEARGRYDLSRSSALPWLYGIAYNVIRTNQRRGARLLRAQERYESLARTEYPKRADVSAVDALDAAWRLRVVANELDRADERLRAPFLMHVWEGLPYSDIAVSLGIPIGTVRSRISRLRRDLSRAIAQHDRPVRGRPTRVQ